MIIYRVVNKTNGKIYIGQTRQPLAKRWMQHCYKKSNNRGLLGAIQKYGKDNFEVTIICNTETQKELDDSEIFYIQYYDCLAPKGYNLTTGGEGGYMRSAETRKLLSEAGKGKRRSHTQESRKKISAAHMGSKNPSFGKKQSQATKQKRSDALKGRPRSEEIKAKISAGHKRRKQAQSPLVANQNPAGAQ